MLAKAGAKPEQVGRVVHATTLFTNPTASTTINPGNSGDTLTVNNLSTTDFSSSLTLGSAGKEFSSITFAGGLTLAVNNSLSASATSAAATTGMRQKTVGSQTRIRNRRMTEKPVGREAWSVGRS